MATLTSSPGSGGDSGSKISVTPRPARATQLDTEGEGVGETAPQVTLPTRPEDWTSSPEIHRFLKLSSDLCTCTVAMPSSNKNKCRYLCKYIYVNKIQTESAQLEALDRR